MKTRFLVIAAIVIMISGFSIVVLLNSNSFPENNTVRKSDAAILDEINRQATIHRSNNQEKFHQQAALMEEKVKQIAAESLGMNIVSVTVDFTDPKTDVGDNNFPFRDAAEIKIPDYRESFPICNIPEKIPVHLKKFLDKPIFALFSKKYAHYNTELEIMDERHMDSLVHYGITTRSEDGMLSASTVFHVNTCTDEIKEEFPLMFCRDVAKNEIHQSFNQDDIIASLQLEDFCTIPLDPWRQAIHEFGNKIQEKRLEMFDVSSDPENYAESKKVWDERERLDSLRHITFLIINSGLDADTTQETIKEYNEKFGSLPDEFLDLIEQRE